MIFSPAVLRAAIDRRVLSDVEAARLLGFPERSVSRWLTGAVEPRRSAVRRMAEVFECDPIDFYVEPEREAA